MKVMFTFSQRRKRFLESLSWALTIGWMGKQKSHFVFLVTKFLWKLLPKGMWMTVLVYNWLNSQRNNLFWYILLYFFLLCPMQLVVSNQWLLFISWQWSVRVINSSTKLYIINILLRLLFFALQKTRTKRWYVDFCFCWVYWISRTHY